AGDWLADPSRWSALRQRLASLVARHAAEHPLEPGVPVEALRQALDLPDRSLVDALVASPLVAAPLVASPLVAPPLVAPPLVARSGRIALAGQGGTLPAPVARAVERVRADLADNPFRAPDTARLAELGLGPRELAAAVRAGALLRVADGVVLL